jgi:hypothetical protein
MEALHVKPNYMMTDADVFKDMARKYIQHFQSLDLLRLCDLQSLPQSFRSFISNFAVAKTDSNLLSVFAYGGSRQCYADIGAGNMRVKGRIVAKIKNVSRFFKPLAKNTLNGDNHMNTVKTYHKWEPEDLTSSISYPLGGALLDALSCCCPMVFPRRRITYRTFL